MYISMYHVNIFPAKYPKQYLDDYNGGYFRCQKIFKNTLAGLLEGRLTT